MAVTDAPDALFWYGCNMTRHGELIRAFLLHNLHLTETPPRWRLGLAELAAGMPEIEDFPVFDRCYPGPTLVLSGGR